MGDLRCVGPGLNKALQLPGVSERSDAEGTRSNYLEDGSKVRNWAELHRALHLQTLAKSRAACGASCGLTSPGGKMGRGQDEYYFC